MRVEFDPLYKSLEELGRESRSGNLDLYMSGRLGSGNVSLAGDFSNGEYPDITNGNGNGFARFEGLPIMSEDELQNVLEARFQNGASGAPENEDLPCKMEEDQDWSGSAARGSAGAQIDSTSGLAMAPDSREVQRSPVTTGAGGSPMAGSRQDMATAPVTTGLMSSAFKPSAPAPARMVNLSELTSSPSHSAGSLRSPPARNLRARRGRPAQHSAEAAAASVGGGSAMSEETTGSEPTAEESVPTAAGGRRNARRGKRKPDPRLDDISDIEEYRKQKRLAKNRATAAVSRDRKRRLMASLEARVAALEAERDMLATQVQEKDSEIARLRGRVSPGSGGAQHGGPAPAPPAMAGDGFFSSPGAGRKALVDSDGDSHNGDDLEF